MNILMIPSWYKNQNNQIKGSFFREQALMFQKRGHNVYIVYVELHSASEKIKNRIETYNDCGLYTLIFHAHSYGYARNMFVYKNVMQIMYKNLVKRVLDVCGSIDIIQAHSFMPAGIVACEIGKKYHIPVITTEHSSKVHTLKLNAIERKYLLQTVTESNRFVCVSESLKKSVQEVCANKMIPVIPNNLSSGFTYKSQLKKKHPFQFVCAGNLIEEKRQLFLVNCFAKAFPHENVSLVIAGIGKLRTLLEESISTLNEENRIKLIGLVPREEMPTLLNESSAFVLLSTNETFGVSYIEALACGCPIIATKNGGANEIVTEDNGILVDVDNEKETIDALRYIFYHYHQYNLESISKLCQIKYGEEAIYKRTLSLYSDVMKEHLEN